VFEPGAGNVVPSAARVLVEFRDISEATLNRLPAEIHATAVTANGQGGVGVQATELVRISPAEMDAKLATLIEAAACGSGAASLRMPSGAGHDAMVLTHHIPTAMLFIPSIAVAATISEKTRVKGIFAWGLMYWLPQCERSISPHDSGRKEKHSQAYWRSSAGRNHLENKLCSISRLWQERGITYEEIADRGGESIISISGKINAGRAAF
jgi:metal-dependent amidase/aminoacylase/carboxypeptidase family protein